MVCRNEREASGNQCGGIGFYDPSASSLDVHPFEEMLKHAIDSKEMEYIVHEYILFEIQGWRALLRV